MDPQGEVSLGGVQSVWSHVTEGFRKTKHKTPLSLQFLIFLQESCKLENIIYIYTSTRTNTKWTGKGLTLEKVLMVQYLMTGKIYPATNVSLHCPLRMSVICNIYFRNEILSKNLLLSIFRETTVHLSISPYLCRNRNAK